MENPTWGDGRVSGELLKLGYKIGRVTVGDKREHVPPASKRAEISSNWSTWLAHDASQMLARDFFTVETAWLCTLMCSSLFV
jgi:hypothetical protein